MKEIIQLIQNEEIEAKFTYTTLTKKANTRVGVSEDKVLLEVNVELLPHSEYAHDLIQNIDKKELIDALKGFMIYQN